MLETYRVPAVSSRWSGPRARLQLVVAGIILVASVAIYTVVTRRAETRMGGEAASQSERYDLLEVRSIEGSMTFPPEVIEAARDVEHVVAVQRYLVASVEGAGITERRVIGLDTGAPLRLPGTSQDTVPEVVKGRAFGPQDAERPVAIVGREYADAGKTVYGYQIAGMIDHSPPIQLGNIEVRVVGMFSTGDRAANAHVLVPLKIAERLSSLSGRASGLYVQVNDPENVEQVERELRVVLGEGVNVRRVSP
ncbi:MAG: ABC transporter permease [Actinomycetota bacterium]|nr:ABC transporter permease [Actinomycetota bacterium]